MNQHKVLKVLAVITTLAGAFLTALRIDPLNIYLLNLGTILWIIVSIQMKDKSLIAVNMGMLFCYGLGLFYTT